VTTAGTWARGLFNSSEYTTRSGLTPHEFVRDLYLAFLHYEPDQGGWDWWTGQVGTSWQNKQAVMDAFINAGPYGQQAGTLYREVLWLTADHLGTPRMIAERTGASVGIKRHDYLPFGEEVVSGQGGRTPQQGYTGDSVRQHFTGYEADGESGLNFAQARYQSPTQGRFLSVDPLGASANILNPQSFNRYSYVNNNPVNSIDPAGLQTQDKEQDPYPKEEKDKIKRAPDGFFESGRNLIAEREGEMDERIQNTRDENAASAEQGDYNEDNSAGGSNGDAQYPTLTDSNSYCSVAVNVIGEQTTNFDTVAGTYTHTGFAFTVLVLVKNGRIGRIGDPNADPEEVKKVDGVQPNGGQWTVGQSITPNTYQVSKRPDGSTFSTSGTLWSPNGKSTDDSPRRASRRVHSKSASWKDSPGWSVSSPVGQIVYGTFTANFVVYAQNTRHPNQRCAVGFNIRETFFMGRWSGSISNPQ